MFDARPPLISNNAVALLEICRDGLVHNAPLPILRNRRDNIVALLSATLSWKSPAPLVAFRYLYSIVGHQPRTKRSDLESRRNVAANQFDLTTSLVQRNSF